MRNAAARIRRRAQRTLFSALLAARRRYGGNQEILIDADGRRLTYTEIVRAALALGRAVTRHTSRGERVGIMLPTGAGAIIAFFATLAYGRVPAMLNFTAGPRNLRAACRAAEVTHVLTARQFIELANLQELAAQMAEFATLIHLEDVRESLTKSDKAAAVIGPYVSQFVFDRARPNDPGVILFTSGTEGDPKGVVLSHANIVANVLQMDAHVTLDRRDIMFNPLPVFHCYGLTAGTFFFLLTGRQVVLHPSPLQVKIIPKRIKETRATILVATDTFLQQYARASDDNDLKSLRFAVCGAERVRDETRELVMRRFDLEVLEGYGVTETAPVLAVNAPGDNHPGTVGRLLPGVEARIDPVEGMKDAGRLLVRGPNVMQGYLSTDEPGVIKPLEDGWHDTGDIVSIDENGYVTIKGRLKRFANIGGELVSLAVVENCASATWPDHLHAAIVIPDKRKGEQIVLVTEYPQADQARLRTWAQSHGVSELAVPKKLIVVSSIPVLGTGKIDYVTVERMVADQLAEERPAPGDAEPEEPAAEEPAAKDPAAESAAGE